MNNRFDVAVLGLGIIGSAIACSLAEKGLSVVGLERFWPAHDRGSSHGHTRLLRKAHFEHPDYTPLAERSYELWESLEKNVGRELLVKTGSLVVGAEESTMFRGTRKALETQQLKHDVLTSRQMTLRFPWLRRRPEELGIWDPDSGVLLAEACVMAYQQRAIRAGAQLRFGSECALADDVLDASPIAIDIGGSRVVADKLIVAAGPWASRVMPRGSIPRLEVERIPTFWLRTREMLGTDWARFPVVLWDHAERPFCIFPDVGGHGVKIGFHHNARPIDPEHLNRSVTEGELSELRTHLQETAPALGHDVVSASACMYTNTRDGHFAVGPLGAGSVFLAAACSGHGFKFAPVVAEIVTDLVVDGATRHSMELFRLDRASLYAASAPVPTGIADGEEAAETELRANQRTAPRG